MLGRIHVSHVCSPIYHEEDGISQHQQAVRDAMFLIEDYIELSRKIHYVELSSTLHCEFRCIQYGIDVRATEVGKRFFDILARSLTSELMVNDELHKHFSYIFTVGLLHGEIGIDLGTKVSFDHTDVGVLAMWFEMVFTSILQASRNVVVVRKNCSELSILPIIEKVHSMGTFQVGTSVTSITDFESASQLSIDPIDCPSVQEKSGNSIEDTKSYKEYAKTPRSRATKFLRSVCMGEPPKKGSDFASAQSHGDPPQPFQSRYLFEQHGLP